MLWTPSWRKGLSLVLCAVASVLLPSVLLGQLRADDRPPVIDVHLHAPLGPAPIDSTLRNRDARLHIMDSLNVKVAVLTGVPDAVQAWRRAAPERLIPALLFPCENGVAPNYGRPCFANRAVFPELDWLRSEIVAGRYAALGEITAQYLGIEPRDPRLAPYFALAEELDVPVFIHVGLGPPRAAYQSSPVPVKSPNFRMAAGNPLLLEEVLVRHPRLRLAVMHAGWPMADEMVSVLYAHPQVYVDLGVLQFIIPRAAYHSFLKELVEAGFASRIMFGSDGGPAQLASGIQAILEADFLTEQQQLDILCGNAARFLRLEPSPCTGRFGVVLPDP